MSDPAPDWTAVDHAALARTLGEARARDESAACARLCELLGIVWRLRDADGCPWDREQTLDSMSRNLVEEACETAEAIAAGEDGHVAEELGDTLMNVLLMSRIAEQQGRFDVAAVAAGIAVKLVRRHPHVFGALRADDAAGALASWDASKRGEREVAGGGRAGALHGVPASLPALLLARKTGERAAAAGFDWPDAAGALDKLREELDELAECLGGTAADEGRIEEELGDVLFAAVNVARKSGLDPELALRRTVEKFRRRFTAMERALGEGLPGATLEEMERHWRAAAAAEGVRHDRA